MTLQNTSTQRSRSKSKEPKGGRTAAGRRKFAKGEPVPKRVAQRAIARRGRASLERAESKKKRSTQARKSSAKKRPGLVDNINARKRAGTSRPKTRSTVAPESYAAMQRGWGKKSKGKRTRATPSASKS